MTEEREAKLYEKLEKFVEENKVSNEVLTEIIDVVLEHETNYIDDVEIFMQSFLQDTPERLIHPTYETMALRLNLIFEELKELSVACGMYPHFLLLCKEEIINKNGTNEEEINVIETLDALVDLQYVLSGAIIAFGFRNDFDDAFDEVQASNMSKVCDTLESARETRDWYLSKKNVETEIVHNSATNKYVVLRKSDKKGLKNINWKSPQFIKFKQWLENNK